MKFKVIYDEKLDRYTSPDFIAYRDYQGLTPNGNPMAGRWVLLDSQGKFIDWDAYRSDLFERNNIDPYTEV